MRSKFDEQLESLNKELIQMGACCEEAITLASKAVTERSTKYTPRIVSMEEEIDHLEHMIESRCLRLLLQQQPVASDLRHISAALKMITDMERIGDQAADIGGMIKYLKGSSIDLVKIRKMSEIAALMVTDSIDAYVKQDIALADRVIADDDKVDRLFDEVKKALITSISENTADCEYAVDMLMIAKYFEKIADHATNIAEWVVFSVTGIHKGEEEL